MKKLIATFLSLVIVILLASCAGTRPPITIPTELPPPHEIKHQPQVILVLSGGGARGLAHIGVIKELAQAGIPVDLVIGTSAGSIIGAIYSDQGSATQVEQTFTSMHLWSVIDFNNFPRSNGLLEGYKLQKFLLAHMQAKTFDELKIPLIVLTTDLTTGESFAILSGPVAPAVQASAAIPGLFDPVHMYGRILIDGGIADPVAVDIAKKYHPKIIIAVNVAEQLDQTVPTNAEDVYQRAYVISRLNISKKSAQGADIIIQPAVGTAGVFAISDRAKLIQAGTTAAQQALPEIKALLKKQHIPLKK
jgi:NTE family protein